MTLSYKLNVMSFRRESLLKPEVEKQLKIEMSKLWLSEEPKYLGKEIAEKLQFGVSIIVKGKETNPYVKVKPEYVFFYRQKFKLPLRKKASFAKTTESKRLGLRKSRYRVQPENLGLMSARQFVKALNWKMDPDSDSFYHKRARSYLILHYWTPLRSSEIYERVIDDFEITKDKMIIHLLRKKKSHEVGDKDEPVSIPLVLTLMTEVVEWLEGKRWVTELRKKGKFVRDEKGEIMMNKRPWAISHDTALQYVKEIFPTAYPHWFRFRFLTAGASNPEISLAELKTKACLTLPALEHYIMAPKILEQSFNRKMVEKLKREGSLSEEDINKLRKHKF